MRPIAVGIFFCIALAGGAACANKLGGMHVELSAVFAAAAAGIVALILAAMPIRLMAGGTPADMAQTGLIATVIQMLILLLCAGLVFLGHVPVGGSFIYWLMAVYVITLVAVVTSITHRVRQNPGTTSKAL